MNKAVLISIQPKWCSLIASGKKTVEVRRTRPKLETPFKCYIYCTLGKPNNPHELLEIHTDDGKIHKANGMVMGEFMCDAVSMNIVGYCKGVACYHNLLNGSCLTEAELMDYGNWKTLYGWHISDLVIYDKPKELNEFIKPCENDLYCEICAMYKEFTEQCGNKALILPRPPQSWCYVERLSGGADHE